MSRAHEITLGSDFRRMARHYVSSFARSYIAYDGQETDYFDNLAKYKKAIEDNFENLVRMAAASINSYINLYGIHVNKSADEFKIIYFFGRAIEKHLGRLGLDEIAQIHMFSMVGLLDFRLAEAGFEKPILTRVLTTLIKLNKFETELGPTGCYLIYKCVSSAKFDEGVMTGAADAGQLLRAVVSAAE